MAGKEVQKRNLILKYILTLVSGNCKPAVRMTGCPKKAQNKLRSMIFAVSEAALDAKLTRLQNIRLKKRVKILEYSNQIVELINELDSAGYSVSRDKQKRALIRGLPSSYVVTAKHILGSNFSFGDVAAKLIVRESRILQHEEQSEVALQMRHNNIAKTCFTCAMHEDFAKNRNRYKKCYKCGKVGHIAENCRNRPADDTGNDGTAMITIH